MTVLQTTGIKKEQLTIINQFGSWFSNQGFYLAGGTALTIYYGHRNSYDLDWFTTSSIQDAFLLAQQIHDKGIPFVIGQTARGTLNGQIGGTRVSLMEYRYPLIQPLTIWEDNQTTLASLDDLACMKLSAIAQRGLRKDFYDIHILITKHRNLDQLIDLYKEKYQVTDISPVLYGLSYFSDAENEPEIKLLSRTPWNQVKEDILRWVKDFAHRK